MTKSYVDRSLFGERSNAKLIRNKRRQKEPSKKQDQEQRSDASALAAAPPPAPIASHELRDIIHSIGPFPTSNDPLALPEPTTSTNAKKV